MDASLQKIRNAGEGNLARSYAECRRVARTSASNFYYAFFMLPQAKRDALCALYAFMRLVDDVSDTVGGAADKQRGLGAGAPHWMALSRVMFLVIRFCSHFRTRSLAFESRRVTFMI